LSFEWGRKTPIMDGLCRRDGSFGLYEFDAKKPVYWSEFTNS